MRKKKDILEGSESCRFYFPYAYRPEAVVLKEYNKSYQLFIAAYNNSKINYFNYLLSIAQRANADISPYTLTKVVIDYILKYYSKAETETMSYKDIIKIILLKVTSKKPFLLFIVKFINSIIGERDQATQEVAHLMLHLPLQRGTRTIVTLNCRRPYNQSIAIEFEDDKASKGKIVLQKYQERLVAFPYTTLFEYITQYNLQR